MTERRYEDEPCSECDRAAVTVVETPSGPQRRCAFHVNWTAPMDCSCGRRHPHRIDPTHAADVELFVVRDRIDGFCLMEILSGASDARWAMGPTPREVWSDTDTREEAESLMAEAVKEMAS